jgi:alpha-beta hydrolase superfamily lysophospholipase
MQTHEGHFLSADGTRLFERVWLPLHEPRAAILIIHGYAEHSGRYDWTARRLVERGYAVHAFDLRGHGHADGERVHVRSMNEYLDDADAALARLLDHAPGAPVFVLGHSMGGGILSLYTVARFPEGGHREAIRGFMFSGAVLPARGLRNAVLSRFMVMLARVFPRMRLKELPSSAVSRDPQVVADYDADPLNYRGKMPVALVSAMIRGSRFVEKHMDEIWLPLLILHGSADELASPAGSQRLYDTAVSADKMLKLYEGLYHEILNEPEKDLVVEDIANWLDRQLERAEREARDADAASAALQ